MGQIRLFIMIAALMAASPAAWAQDHGAEQPTEEDLARARELYQSAEAHKKQADELAAGGQAGAAKQAYGLAARDYLAGYQLSRLPAFLYNLGSVYRLRGEKRWAVRCYQAFLVTNPDDPDSLAFLRELEAALAAGEAGARPELAIDPGDACPGEEEPGHAEVEAEADAGGPPGLDELGRDEAVLPGGGYRTAFYVGASVTVASGAAALVTLLQTGSLEDETRYAIEVYQSIHMDQLDVSDPCSDARSRRYAGLVAVMEACDRGESRARLSNLFQGITLVSAAATGYFFYKGYLGHGSGQAKRAGAAQLTPLVMPDTVGAELMLRF